MAREHTSTGRREQNKLEKRARIIAAARALFKHKGFDATTTQEIAAAASVASGTIFTYARTKEHCFASWAMSAPMTSASSFLN